MQLMENIDFLKNIFFSLLMVTFLIIIGRVPAIIRFRGIFFSQKVIFIDLLKIKCRAKEKSDFDENDIFDRFRSRCIVLVVVAI